MQPLYTDVRKVGMKNSPGTSPSCMHMAEVYLSHARATWGCQLYFCHHLLVHPVGILLVIVPALRVTAADKLAQG